MKHAKIRKFPIILIVIILLIAVAVTAILLFNNYKLDKLKHMSDLYFMNLVEEQQIGKKEMDINYDNNNSQVIEYPKIYMIK